MVSKNTPNQQQTEIGKTAFCKRKHCQLWSDYLRHPIFLLKIYTL